MSHENLYCKNCGQHLMPAQKFCHECGQNTDTHRINFHYLFHELQHSLFHVDRGILFTLKELFTRPGDAIREYIEGKRKNKFPPVTLVMILGAAMLLVNKLAFHNEEILGKLIHISSISSTGTAAAQKSLLVVRHFTQLFSEVREWLNAHFEISLLLMVPLYAIALWIAFFSFDKAKRYNLAEYFVISCYLTAQALVVFFLLIPFKEYSHIFYIALPICTGLNLWALIRFFRERPPLHTFGRFVIAAFINIFLAALIIGTFLVIGFQTAYSSGILKR